MLQFKYDKVTTVEDGVKRLLTVRDREIPEFEIVKRPEGEYTDILVLGGKRIPLLWWRYEARMNSMKNYGRKAPLENCALNSKSFVGKDEPIDALIYRELDISEYVLVSPVKKVTAFLNGDACNLLGKTESGAMLGLELGATMAPGTIPQFDHRIITKHGMATDRTVNNVVEQSGVYLFADSDPRPVAFDDGEYYLYGLSVEDSTRAAFAFAVILGNVNADDLIAQDKHLRALLGAVKASSECGKSVIIEGEGV